MFYDELKSKLQELSEECKRSKKDSANVAQLLAYLLIESRAISIDNLRGNKNYYKLLNFYRNEENMHKQLNKDLPRIYHKEDLDCDACIEGGKLYTKDKHKAENLLEAALAYLEGCTHYDHKICSKLNQYKMQGGKALFLMNLDKEQIKKPKSLKTDVSYLELLNLFGVKVGTPLSFVDEGFIIIPEDNILKVYNKYSKDHTDAVGFSENLFKIVFERDLLSELRIENNVVMYKDKYLMDIVTSIRPNMRSGNNYRG